MLKLACGLVCEQNKLFIIKKDHGQRCGKRCHALIKVLLQWWRKADYLIVNGRMGRKWPYSTVIQSLLNCFLLKLNWRSLVPPSLTLNAASSTNLSWRQTVTNLSFCILGRNIIIRAFSYITEYYSNGWYWVIYAIHLISEWQLIYHLVPPLSLKWAEACLHFRWDDT